jgi:hypothetical protein
MPGVSATIDLHIRAKQEGTAGLGTPGMLVDVEAQRDFSQGTATVDQTNVLYQARRTLAASTGEDLDLAGVLADALGATIAAAEVTAVYIEALAANTNDVVVTRAATNGVPIFLLANGGLNVGPGDFFLLTNRKGITVTAATGDLLHVANGGAGSSVTYDVIIIGRTVAA